ncbi:MAG TPA: cytochrome P450 [Frankiaceae bacterium]|jgi:cytochrome P450|nr:cytochrome P450 [Frankiaceae bacterium]
MSIIEQPEKACPMATGFRFVGTGPVNSGFEVLDSLQDQHRMWRVEEPQGSYWMVLDRELLVRGLQDTATFSSTAITPLDPNPAFVMKPVGLDPPEHGKWRRMLASYFSPRRMPQLEKRALERCTELLDDIVAAGECDYVTDFALKYPTTIFLEIMGLPQEELDTFLEWEFEIVHPDDNGMLDRDRQTNAMMMVMGRLMREIAERRTNPRPDATDIISHAAGWELDEKPIADDDILSCGLLLFLAGLDTVANELSMAMHHLATHPGDRAALATSPQETAPSAVEELLRMYAIPQLARKVTRDVEFGGQQLRKGEMVMFSLCAANRDPSAVDQAREVVLDRDPTPHYTFGAGPHRCIGSHLARLEMEIALREWHSRIPDYELATPEPVQEYRGSIYGLVHLPLRWGQ